MSRRPRRVHRRGSPRIRTLRRVVGLAVVAVLLWGAGLVWFASGLPRAPIAPDRHTDAIVVLTGGAARLAEGLALLQAGMAKKLFVSGVYRGVDVAELLRMARRDPAELECCIALGYTADNTRGNARETAEWMHKEGYHSLRLVTASYHMPRSLLEFRRRLDDVEIIPHAVLPDRFKLDAWWSWPGTAGLIASEYNKYLLAVLYLEPGAS